MQRIWPQFMPLPLDDDDNHPCSFSAIFADPFAASFYSLTWAEVGCCYLVYHLHAIYLQWSNEVLHTLAFVCSNVSACKITWKIVDRFQYNFPMDGFYDEDMLSLYGLDAGWGLMSFVNYSFINVCKGHLCRRLHCSWEHTLLLLFVSLWKVLCSDDDAMVTVSDLCQEFLSRSSAQQPPHTCTCTPKHRINHHMHAPMHPDSIVWHRSKVSEATKLGIFLRSGLVSHFAHGCRGKMGHHHFCLATLQCIAPLTANSLQNGQFWAVLIA